MFLLFSENNSTEEPNSTTSSKDSTPEAVATSSGDISIEVSQDESSSSDTCSKFPKSDDSECLHYHISSKSATPLFNMQGKYNVKIHPDTKYKPGSFGRILIRGVETNYKI